MPTSGCHCSRGVDSSLSGRCCPVLTVPQRQDTLVAHRVLPGLTRVRTRSSHIWQSFDLWPRLLVVVVVPLFGRLVVEVDLDVDDLLRRLLLFNRLTAGQRRSARTGGIGRRFWVDMRGKHVVDA